MFNKIFFSSSILIAFVSLTFLCCSKKVDSTPILEFEDFRFQLNDTKLYQISFETKMKNVNKVSFFIEKVKSPDDFIPEGFFRDQNSKIYLSEVSGAGNKNLKDNGTIDEDNDPNKFSCRLNTEGWPTGKYRFSVGLLGTDLKGVDIITKKDIEFNFDNGDGNGELDVSIKIKEFKIEYISGSKVKISYAASSKDGVVGSFMIRLQDSPDGFIPDGFLLQDNSGAYFISEEKHKKNFLLMDNGNVDEDPRDGRFAYTFDMTKWKKGGYTLYVGAQNRPQEGAYIGDGRYIRVGDNMNFRELESVENKLIYQRDGEYSVFPSLTIQPDNSLALTFSTRSFRSHIDPQGGQQQLVSYDEGDSWQMATRRVLNKLWVTGRGFLVSPQPGGWWQAPESEYAKLKSEGRFIQNVKPGIIAYYGDSYVRKSTNNGESWSKENIPMPSYCRGTMNYLERASFIRTSKGTMLQVAYGVRADSTTSSGHGDKLEVFLHRSEDDGSTWKGYAMYPDGLPDVGVGFDESTIEQAMDGAIIMLMRSSKENYLWEAISNDDGKTWSFPVKTEIYGYPAHLKRLKDGRLLCAYSYRVMPMGIRMVLSYDNGKTWDVDNTMVVRSDGYGNPSDLGYPLIFERSDGRILLTYYFTTREMDTHIASSIVELP